MNRENEFETTKGRSTLFHSSIAAYTVIDSLREDTYWVDVHLHSGTVFTIQPEDVERFLAWMSDMTNTIRYDMNKRGNKNDK